MHQNIFQHFIALCTPILLTTTITMSPYYEHHTDTDLLCPSPCSFFSFSFGRPTSSPNLPATIVHTYLCLYSYAAHVDTITMSPYYEHHTDTDLLCTSPCSFFSFLSFFSRPTTSSPNLPTTCHHCSYLPMLLIFLCSTCRHLHYLTYTLSSYSLSHTLAACYLHMITSANNNTTFTI